MDKNARPGSSGTADAIVLGLLTAVASNSELTQRSLAREFGVALGLVNIYLRRCVKKGYIKVTRAPTSRYAYYLTPTGFAEKSRLTAQYLYHSLGFFRRARDELNAAFSRCCERNWRRILLAGAGELGEIALLCAREWPVEIIGFLDERYPEGCCSGTVVANSFESCAPSDAVIVTDVKVPQATYEKLRALVREDRILAPPLLQIVRSSGPRQNANDEDV